MGNKASTGEGAKEKLREYFAASKFAPRFADHFTQWLDEQGFIIVPKPSARRGNSRKPPVYTGPAMIGQSHTARLIR